MQERNTTNQTASKTTTRSIKTLATATRRNPTQNQAVLQKILISNVRNLAQTTLNLAPINILIGDNGSGKTSFLEAIHLLAMGKSFRQHQPKHYIQHGTANCSVFAQSQLHTHAIAKDQEAATKLKLNGDAATQAQITSALPLLILDPTNMDILEDGSTERRRLLDWVCFHSDHAFYGHWLAYQKMLKQRNALLKSPTFGAAQKRELLAWDNMLSDKAASLHAIRLRAFAAWQQAFLLCAKNLLDKAIFLSYHAGFDTKLPLFDSLQTRFDSDRAAGFTRLGSHRADVAIYWRDELGKNHQAVNVLSRGEKKLLIMALKLAQLLVICGWTDCENMENLHNVNEQNNLDGCTQSAMPNPPKLLTPPRKTPLVLIDDIGAELDKHAMARLLAALLTVRCQLFITSLDDKILRTLAALNMPDDKAIARFTVANGIIQPTDNQ